MLRLFISIVVSLISVIYYFKMYEVMGPRETGEVVQVTRKLEVQAYFIHDFGTILASAFLVLLLIF